jgi:hypothetical protein
MTVCIASICESLQGLVAVADQMLTFENISVDGTGEKINPLHRNWFAMYSGNDITDVRPILDTATIILCSENRERALGEIGEVFELAYARRHQQLIEIRVLMPSGFQGLDDFHERGKKSLTSTKFNQILRRIEEVVPGCEFLIGGFDLFGSAHLLLQEAKSPYKCFDDPGFWAIGSGQSEAISSLLFQADRLGFSINSSEEACIYHLLAAKFASESNKFVGKETHVIVRRFNEPPVYLVPEAIDHIREVWEEYSIPRLPSGLIKEIPKMLITTEEVRALRANQAASSD